MFKELKYRIKKRLTKWFWRKAIKIIQPHVHFQIDLNGYKIMITGKGINPTFYDYPLTDETVKLFSFKDLEISEHDNG